MKFCPKIGGKNLSLVKKVGGNARCSPMFAGKKEKFSISFVQKQLNQLYLHSRW
jgi:hypothetical protein